MDELSNIALALAIGVLAALLPSVSVVLDRIRGKVSAPLPELTLERRLADLGELMRSSSVLLEEVQAEIQARISLADKAKRDAAEAESLAQMNDAQRIAVARLVRAELAVEVRKSSTRSFWQGFAANFVFFALGVIASIVTTMYLEK
ncbi:hypothetical protein KBX71_15060 [Micromonospora sp. D93]|uniref:hypothetical protein n=1 Tax=Micromonospora sp. D93 TaxID=2824886 RepID=UPI001B38C1DC|nr:hypothetical protein [Micromonospora sp. D93]MBQ1019175.1 hypothetical protein [Micromonospora sp. D93]